MAPADGGRGGGAARQSHGGRGQRIAVGTADGGAGGDATVTFGSPTAVSGALGRAVAQSSSTNTGDTGDASS